MNRLIPLIAIIILVGAAFVVLRAVQTQTPPQPSMLSELPTAPAPDADTPADTVRTLSAQVADLLDSTKNLTEENRVLREQNQTLVNRQREDDTRIQAHVRQDLTRQQNVDGAVLSSLTRRVDQLSAQLTDKLNAVPTDSAATDDMPVGFGYEDDVSTIHWVQPLNATEMASRAGFTPGESLLKTSDTKTTGHGQRAGVAKRDKAGKAKAKAEPKPYYTIPANATLARSTAFSALVGRVPIGGQVQDPMPFKVLIGEPNLAANGHEIPGIESMVMSGYAVGDWTLSCVRGYITSATFVFHDGSIVTVGDEKKKAGSDAKRAEESIGWVSDRFGVPCVSGKRITNAPQFLSQRVGLMALRAAAEAYAAGETTAVVSTDTGVATSTVTGDPGTYALGSAVSGGAEEVSQWLEERQAQSFDAIFVAAGTPLTVNLDVSIPIDLDPNGRRLDHRLARAPSEGTPHEYLD
ncbi:MAG: TIGR03752 family integrating conjugative element protein [Candidatus Sedimenticola endophacoides]